MFTSRVKSCLQTHHNYSSPTCVKCGVASSYDVGGFLKLYLEISAAR